VKPVNCSPAFPADRFCFLSSGVSLAHSAR
jgi:hypothetical protein